MKLDGFNYDRLGGFAADGDDALRSMLGRPILWYTDPEDGWLARDPSYSPQPYVQLAAALRKAGELDKADQVLYASRERARRVYAGREPTHPEARSWPRWLWLSTLKWTIGYGIGLRYFRALLWVIFFTAVGTALVVYGQGQGLVTHDRSGEARVSAQPAKPTAGQSPEAVGPSSNQRRADEVWPASTTDWSDRLLRDVFYSLDELLPIVTLDRTHDKVELGGCVRYYFMLHRLLGFLLGGFILAGLSGLTQKS